MKLAEFDRMLQRHPDGASEQRVDRIYPKHLTRKNRPYIARNGFSDQV